MSPSLSPVLAPLRSSPLKVSWARNEKDLLRAQKLRALAFGFSPPKTPESLIVPEQDRFDAFARHLIVVDTDRDLCVGTYRILDFRGAQRAGGFYTGTEFDITSLSPFLEHTAELGRSAVHPDYRSGGVISLLWSALARILMKEEIRYLMGCASCDLTDPSLDLDRIYTYLRLEAWGEEREAVVPYRHYPCLFRPTQNPTPPSLPPLLKGYVRLGARILGEPSHDPVFQTADFPVWLSVNETSGRYARHFFRSGRRAVRGGRSE